MVYDRYNYREWISRDFGDLGVSENGEYLKILMIFDGF